MGPDGKGRCTARFQSQCTPRREGDRWYCNRLETFGGPCARGPLPGGSCCRPKPEHPICQPRLSIRAKRSRLILASITLTFGALVTLIAGPWRMSFISPGSLSSSHLAIEGKSGATNNCAVCHNAAEATGSRERAAFGVGIPGSAPENMLASGRDLHESMKCLTCHFTKSQQTASFVHSLPPEHLAEISKRVASDAESTNGPPTAKLALASLLGSPPQSERGAMACSACHREHRGRHHDLTFMDDTRCQVCHAVQFKSFNHGHPKFSLVARTAGGMQFNHGRHQETHFGDSEFRCTRCHMPDDAGQTMLLKPFAQSCAGCHSGGRTDHHAEEIKKNVLNILQLPEMEFDDDLYWPLDCALGDEEIPLMMWLFLAGDDEALDALSDLYSKADGIPIDWEPENQSLKPQLASAIKRLIHDLVRKDDHIWRTRIAKALDTTATDPHVAALAEQLGSATFVMLAYQQHCLPLLADDIEGKNIEGDEEVDEVDWTLPTGSSGWFIDSDYLSVNYRPVGHADGLLKNWIDAIVNHTSTTPSDSIRQQFRQQILEQLISRKAGGFLYGACIRCHNVDQIGSKYQVNWFAAGRERGASGYAKFNHRPHMAMLREADNCQQCHKLATTSEAHHLPRSFLAHDKSKCASCHAPGRANNSCLNCHDYHVHRP